MKTNRLLGWLIGLLTGLFLCCCGTAVLFAIGGGGKATTPAAVAADGTLEVAIDEAYLSRTMVKNASAYPSPWPIVGGRMDVQPGNQAEFDVLVASPTGRLKISGELTFRATGGKVQIHIAEVELGILPVTGLLAVFAPNLEEQINATANQQLQERTAGAGVKLVGVTTDDQFLRFYFTGQ